MKSFNDFSSFDSRRDRLFSSSTFSTPRSLSKRGEETNRSGAVSAFLQAFESSLNEKAIRKDGEKNDEMREKRGAESDASDCRDREEFERLRKIAGNLAGSVVDRRDREEFERLRKIAGNLAGSVVDRRAEFTKRFSEPERDASADCFSSREDVENAFRLDGPPDATATIDGKSYIYFGGDGYLGLQADPEMLAVACEAAMKYGLASATSRRCLRSAPALEVERNAAKLFGVSRAFYSLNETTIGELTLKTLAGSFDRVFVDETILPFWAPILDKLSLGFAPIGFRRCDSIDFNEKLRKNLKAGERPLAITDGVFADCGSIAPLDRYVASLGRFPGAALLVNDSQAVGVLGANGRGTFEYFGFDFDRVNRTNFDTEFDPFEGATIDDPIFGGYSDEKAPRRTEVRLFMFASLAKAVGGFGCVAPGGDYFVEKLIEASDDFCGAIPSNPIAAATARGLRLLTTAPELRLRLRENVRRLRAGLRDLGLDVGDSPVPIVAFQLGSQQNMRRIQRALANERILVSYLPARRDDSRGLIRIAVFATHSNETIDAALESLRKVL